MDFGDIETIRFQQALTDSPESPKESDGRTDEWNGTPIPPSILESIEHENLVEFEGAVGNPYDGSPAQVERIEIEGVDNAGERTVYNRAFVLIRENNEESRRIHRVCQTFSNEVGRTPSNT